ACSSRIPNFLSIILFWHKLLKICSGLAKGANRNACPYCRLSETEGGLAAMACPKSWNQSADFRDQVRLSSRYDQEPESDEPKRKKLKENENTTDKKAHEERMISETIGAQNSTQVHTFSDIVSCY
ncbi:hypothetical protein PMAYCL1PPCAC_31693, partial [Pristionchus mayeri]